MKDKLKDDILSLCTGYDATYVSKVLAELQCDVVLRHVVRDPEIKVCPRCGKQGAYVTEVYNGTGNVKRKVALMVFCGACKFHGPKVMKTDLPHEATDTIWRWKAIEAWNNTVTCNLMELCDELFGKKYQFDLFHEETVELMQALFKVSIRESHFQRGDRRTVTKDVVPEMADVIICIYQWLHSVDIDFTQLDNAMKEKVNRLCRHASVRTAIAELSRKVTDLTTVTSASTADTSSSKPT